METPAIVALYLRSLPDEIAVPSANERQHGWIGLKFSTIAFDQTLPLMPLDVHDGVVDIAALMAPLPPAKSNFLLEAWA